jgi:transmembrane sensor
MTMTQSQTEIHARALDWVVRMRDADFDRWEEFADWLGAQPSHAEAYQRLAIEDQDLDLLLPPKVLYQPAPEFRARGWRRIGLTSGGIAAAIVAVFAAHLTFAGPHLYDVQTAPGERRQIALPNGTIIALNGGTRLRLDHDNPRFAEVRQGEALFEVAHDADHPFTVHVGDGRLVDLGTRFDIMRSNAGTEIAVAEGSVRYDVADRHVALAPGDTLRVSADGRVATKGVVPVAQIGTWREGRFVYSGEPLSRVAADLSRYTGQPVTAAPDIAGQPFRGVISVSDRHNLQPLGPLFGARIDRRGNGWLISRY